MVMLAKRTRKRPERAGEVANGDRPRSCDAFSCPGRFPNRVPDEAGARSYRYQRGGMRTGGGVRHRSSPDADARDGHDMSDEDLVAAAQRDPARFDALYERYHREIAAFVRSRAEGDQAHIEDLVSRAFAKTLAGLASFRAGSFRGWLYRITRNVIIDDARARKFTLPIENAESVADGRQHVDERVMQRMQAAVLRDAVDELTGTQRAVIDLRLAGMTAPQIARQLDMNTEAVKSAQYRAFEKLRDHFAKTGQIRREDL